MYWSDKDEPTQEDPDIFELLQIEWRRIARLPRLLGDAAKRLTRQT